MVSMTSHKAKMIAFSGSNRSDSFNKKLARLAVQIASEQGVDAEFIDLRDYELPLYDGDYEQNNDYPVNALKLKNLLKSVDGFLISAPEYNSSITPVLKNTIDWISRSQNKGTDLSPFTGKIAAIVSAAPGKLGGLRGLVHLRSILSNIGTIVIPNQLAVPLAASALNKDKLQDETQSEQFYDVVKTLVDTCKRYKIDLHEYCQTLFDEFKFKS